jgi:hypothetical protein
MGSLERKVCALIVIEERRLPFCGRVAFHAASRCSSCKLIAMNVLVTAVTPGRSRPEIHVREFDL